MAYEYKGYNPKNSKHVQKYVKNHYKRITLDFNKDYFEDVLKPLCDSIGVTVPAFIKTTIEKEANRILEERKAQ